MDGNFPTIKVVAFVEGFFNQDQLEYSTTFQIKISDIFLLTKHIYQ